MTIKSKILVLNLVAGTISLILGGILVFQSARESRELANFSKVSALLVQMIKIGDTMTVESGGVWRTSVKHTPEDQIAKGMETYRERIANTDAMIEELKAMVAAMDLDPHSRRFRDLVENELEFESRLAPIRARSADKNNDPWPTTLLYNEQIKWLVGLISQLATETNDAELVRKIIVSDLVLQAQLMHDRHAGLLNYALTSGAVTEMVTTRFEVYLDDAPPLVARIRMIVDASALDELDRHIENEHFRRIEDATRRVFDGGFVEDGVPKKFDQALIDGASNATARLTEGIAAFRAHILQDIETYTEAEIARAQAKMIKSVAIVLAAALACGLGGWYIVNRIERSIRSVAEKLEASSRNGQKLSKWISASSADLASGCSQQAASIQEVHSTMEQIKSMADDSVERVEGVLDLAAQTNASAQSSSTSMRRMREAMSKIQGSSNEIAQIVKEIEEIAFQTNILALNAAVEAARAGEAGAGFAIVADEVRTLARKSAASANSTREKIENAHRSVKEGTALSEEVEAQLGRILDQVGTFKQAMNEVERISDQQRSAIDNVASAISDIDSVTQRNAASAEESASASLDMDGSARAILQQIEALERLLIGTKFMDARRTKAERELPPTRGKPASERPAGKPRSSPARVSSSARAEAPAEAEPNLWN